MKLFKNLCCSPKQNLCLAWHAPTFSLKYFKFWGRDPRKSRRETWCLIRWKTLWSCCRSVSSQVSWGKADHMVCPSLNKYLCVPLLILCPPPTANLSALPVGRELVKRELHLCPWDRLTLSAPTCLWLSPQWLAVRETRASPLWSLF